MLARVIVESFHDWQAANAASEEFRRRFADHQLPSDLETKRIEGSPIGILNLICQAGFAASNSEARRLVTQGAVTFADQKITDPKHQIQLKDPQILRVGKRRICRVAPAGSSG